MNGLMSGTPKSRPRASRPAARDRDGHRPAPPGSAQPPPDGVQLEVHDPREVRPGVLETFPYEYPGSPAIVEISTDEFTAVCPWS